jgi:hypothetical protein
LFIFSSLCGRIKKDSLGGEDAHDRKGDFPLSFLLPVRGGAPGAAVIMLFDGKIADARLPLVALVIFAVAWSWFLCLLIIKAKKN